MDTMQNRHAAPHMRASDADRDVVLAELSTSFEAGRLTPEDLDERTSRALSARTVGELGALTADLPTAESPVVTTPVVTPPVGPAHRLQPGRPPIIIVAVMVVAIVAIVTGPAAHASWHAWWLVLIPLIFARRLARRRGQRGFARQDRS